MAPAAHFLFALLAAFAPGTLASCAYGTHLHPRATEGEIAEPKFGYIGTKGPTNWHALDVANGACANGSNQSPIDMVSESFTMVPGSELNINIPDFEEGAEFENLGTTVEVIAKGGTMSVGDVEFSLKQFHFHLPSEHLDNGTSMAMEMHMVWQSEDSKIAVVGVYIDIDDAAAAERAPNSTVAASAPYSTQAHSRSRKHKNLRKEATKEQVQRRAGFKATEAPVTEAAASTVLETVLGSVDQIPNLGNTLETEPLVMSEIVDLLTAGSFQSYHGSLTTPPCSEGVSWFVSTQKLSIQPSTFIKARNVIGFNSRYPQNSPGEENVLQLAAASM
ncbi:alpha carbonic anhydrase [Thelonectria olida]|uniref:carbonic anhydrase n=1 Tax=Thelonectria olida TaxID=1576542 RepID=A0A9P8W4A0_9HYPO|nr:alpha carbonic anhydrase [Thelonectria olida]